MTTGPELDPRFACLVRFGALVTLGGSMASFQRLISDMTIAGLSVDEMLAALVDLASVVGHARIAAAAPKIALTLGYDVDPALLDRVEPSRD